MMLHLVGRFHGIGAEFDLQQYQPGEVDLPQGGRTLTGELYSAAVYGEKVNDDCNCGSSSIITVCDELELVIQITRFCCGT